MSAYAVTVLGRAYIFLSLVVLILGVVWASALLVENHHAVEVTVWLPQLELGQMFRREQVYVDASILLLGWGIGGALLLWSAMRAPFRLRGAALSQRRMRELEQEILELRRLPLRQQEEDEILAAEAHLDDRPINVMTEKLRLEGVRKGTLTPGDRKA